MPDLLAEDRLMPIFAEFCRHYLNIELDIIYSTKTFNLANREADIAFRICDKPPEYHIAPKLARLHH
jgi:DNA-binding transcriptional LysR family regulator